MGEQYDECMQDGIPISKEDQLKIVGKQILRGGPRPMPVIGCRRVKKIDVVDESEDEDDDWKMKTGQR